MSGIYMLIPTLLVVFVSYLIVRAGAIALRMTGMEEEKARFQALSAFTGTGFTTKEAEFVVNHPTRRRIISWLMILGHAGIVTVIVTATSSLITTKGYQLSINALFLIVGIYLIHRLTRHKKLMRKWEDFIKRKLMKLPQFDEGLAEDLLHFLEGYGLVRIPVKKGSEFVGKEIGKLGLKEKGIIVLGIERGKKWMHAPEDYEKILSEDRIVVYGPLSTLKEFSLKKGKDEEKREKEG
ncbi:hypothetical protein J7L87_03630 [bacterium]|nr:hypothetical protein [bacterium]